MKQKLASAKHFVLRNERRILITTTVLTLGAATVMRAGLKQHDDFLKEHDLFDEFYRLTD